MTQNEMQFDFDGIITLLAKNLYSEKQIFIRELIQNAHDSILRRKSAEGDAYSGRIDLYTHPDELFLTVRDNGLGMSEQDLRNYLSCIGKSGTKTESQGIAGVIGQFGIGFLSAFLVADSVEVLTRRKDETTGWHWSNTGKKTYTLDAAKQELPVGTTVKVHLRSVTDRGLLDPDAVRNSIHLYGTMLSVPIHLNSGTHPINEMVMPWEKQWADEKEWDLETHVFLEKTMGSSVLEIIPIRLENNLPVHGCLYINKTRSIAIETPRMVKLYQNRMFITNKADDILPKWATFVDGVINADHLTPTAARDNFIRNDDSQALQVALGELIIQHLLRLKDKNPNRFRAIQQFHNLGIKAACEHYDLFFDQFADLLLWRLNSGTENGKTMDVLQENWKTLPEILIQQPNREIACFSSRNSANQYFAMADAAKTLVVDASYPFEEKILKNYAKKMEKQGQPIRLVWVDREDDPHVFQRLAAGEEMEIVRLAEEMSRYIKPGGFGRLEVAVRRFSPTDLAAVLRNNEETRGQETANNILNNPDTPSDLRAMAEELKRLNRNAKTHLHINANNDLVRQLAALVAQRPHDNTLIHIMKGIFNNAILLNSELMTPENAQILHQQFQELLKDRLDSLKNDVQFLKEQHQREIEALQRKIDTLQPISRAPRDFLSIFLMIPYDEEHREIEGELRHIVEEDWGCRLLLAKDQTFAPDVKSNVGRHIAEADAFIAVVTTLNKNVMIEVGRSMEAKPNARLFLIYDGKILPDLPKDLAGLIYCDYSKANGDRREYMRRDMENDTGWKGQLNTPHRGKIVTATMLATRLEEEDLAFCQKLAAQYPTEAAWKNASVDALRSLGVKTDREAKLFMKLMRE